MTAILHRIFIHTSKKEEIKLPHLEPRTQRVKDSKPPGFKDSKIQALQDSRIQAFKDSRAHRWKDSAIHVWAFVPRTAAPDLPELNLWIPPEQSILGAVPITNTPWIPMDSYGFVFTIAFHNVFKSFPKGNGQPPK